MTLVRFLLLLIIILAVSGFGVFYYWDDLSSMSLQTVAVTLIGSMAGALLLDVLLPRRRK